ncbi:TPA: hypothetical protein ACQZHW_004291 [Enterobacter hormaechei]|nr:hypothetical protein [Enterobacter hormaechei]
MKKIDAQLGQGFAHPERSLTAILGNNSAAHKSVLRDEEPRYA